MDFARLIASVGKITLKAVSTVTLGNPSLANCEHLLQQQTKSQAAMRTNPAVLKAQAVMSLSVQLLKQHCETKSQITMTPWPSKANLPTLEQLLVS
jgi:hypothetical protein